MHNDKDCVGANKTSKGVCLRKKIHHLTLIKHIDLCWIVLLVTIFSNTLLRWGFLTENIIYTIRQMFNLVIPIRPIGFHCHVKYCCSVCEEKVKHWKFFMKLISYWYDIITMSNSRVMLIARSFDFLPIVYSKNTVRSTRAQVLSSHLLYMYMYLVDIHHIL